MCVRLLGQVTLTFDRLTLKLVRESHQRWGTYVPNLGTLGLRVLELFALYATDGGTDRRTDKSKPYFPLSTGGGIITAQLKASHDTGTTNGLRNLVVPMSEELVIVCVGMRGDARQVK